LGGTVPLSEHEQRQLEQIEQALYAEHPRFAKAVRAADPRVHYRRRVVYAAIGFAIGLVLLPVGISTNLVALSVLGFVVMLGCCYWAALSYRRMNGLPAGRVLIKERRPRRRESKASRSRRSGSGFGVRLEERWRRRQEGQGK
jgi:Na+/proline symporter